MLTPGAIKGVSLPQCGQAIMEPTAFAGKEMRPLQWRQAHLRLGAAAVAATGAGGGGAAGAGKATELLQCGHWIVEPPADAG